MEIMRKALKKLAASVTALALAALPLSDGIAVTALAEAAGESETIVGETLPISETMETGETSESWETLEDSGSTADVETMPAAEMPGDNIISPDSLTSSDGVYDYEILDDGTVCITGFNASAWHLDIPSEIDGRTVTKIGDWAFENNGLGEITIPDTIIEIGAFAFSGCSLSNVVIPNSVVKIGGGAFMDNRLISITTPGCLIDVLKRDKYPYLTDLIITLGAEDYYYEDSVLFSNDKSKLIWYFASKTNDTYTVPSEVVEISEYSFMYSESLKKIEMPNSVVTIGEGAFLHCSGLTDITIPSGVTVIEDDTFSSCENLSNVVLHDGITSIGVAAFNCCRNLSEIEIPDSVLEIKSVSDTVYLPAYKYREYGAFSRSGLVKISLPKGVTGIAPGTFWDCDELKEVTIPHNIERIGTSAFYSADNLQDVYYDGTEDEWNELSIAIGNEDLTSAAIHFNTDLYKYYIIIPENVFVTDLEGHNIENGAEVKPGDKLTITATIPEGYVSVKLKVNGEDIENGGVYTVGNKRVVITAEFEPLFAYEENDDGTIRITNYNGTDSTVVIPSEIDGKIVASISSRAFENPSAITSITTPDRLLNSLKRCILTNLTEINLSTNGENYTQVDGVLFNKDMTELIWYLCGKTNTEYTIPDSVTKISNLAFNGTDRLTKVTIPNSVTEIGITIFNCVLLESISTPGWLIYELKHCELPNLTDIIITADNENYTLADGVLFNKDMTELIWYLSGKPETSYKIPDGVISIDYLAFFCAKSLISVEMSDTVTTLKRGLNFAECTNLSNIRLSNNLTNLGSDTFINCLSLTEISIPDSVQRIYGCFIGCVKLKSISIPYGMVKISESGFYECYSLTDVYYGGTEDEWKAIEIGERNEALLSANIHYSDQPHKYYVTIPEHVTVTRNGETLTDGAEVFVGDELTINVAVPDGYVLDYFTVNYREFENGGTYTVDHKPVLIRADVLPIEEAMIVTFPENISVYDTYYERYLESGDHVSEGDQLVITATPPEGHVLTSLKVNGEDFTSGETFTVGDRSVIITAEFAPISVEVLTVTFPQNVTVERDGAMLNSGEEIHTDEVLKITAVPPEGYTLTSLKVNGEDFTSGETFTVGDKSVIITADFEPISSEKLTVTFPENVIVTRTEVILTSGDEVHTGDVLLITAKPPRGQVLKTLTVNGAAIANESKYTVGTENVVIQAEFVPETAEVTPVSIRIASMPYKTSYYVGQKLDLSGCSIDVTYSDNSVKNVTVTDDMVSGFDSDTAGRKTIIVTYEGLTAAFEVTVTRRSSGGSGGGSHYTPSYPSTPTEPDEGAVSGGSEGALDSWSDIAEALREYSGKVLTVELNEDTVVPAVAIKALYDNNATLCAKTSDGYTWTINGGNVNGQIGAVDLGISAGGYIPSYLIEGVGGMDVKRLGIRFDNQHKAALSFAVDAKYSGQYASLMRVNEKLTALEFVSSCLIGADGAVRFVPDKAGEYVVIADIETKLFGDMNNDGSLDTNDVSDVLKYIVGMVGKPVRKNLDLNGDGIFDAMDAAYIFKKFEDENDLV